MNSFVENPVYNSFRSVEKSSSCVENSVKNIVYFVRESVKKLFGFTKTSVRFSTKSCSVDKYYTAFTQFGSVRFISVIRQYLWSFAHFPQGLLLLLFI